MSAIETHPQILECLASELRPAVVERTEALLLKIVRANLNTQYGSKAVLLANFRDAISAQDATSDSQLIKDFRRSVPLSDYDSYRPFMTAFENDPCSETELENLFAPGLPFFLAVSSATSGKRPKIFPKYDLSFLPRISNPTEGPVASVFFCGYQDIKNVEREPGQVVKRIFVSTVTAGVVRAMLGWTNVEDDGIWLPVIAPGFVAPLAASTINSHKPFLMIHALFALACRGLSRITLVYSTTFCDLVRYVDEEWDLFLSSIRNGTVPDLPGVHEVHSHLQTHLQANPDRAAELGEIGPPFSCTGWAALVWPKLRMVSFGCSGPFAAVLPKVKSILGETIAIHSAGYGSSESLIATAFRPDNLDTFVLGSNDLIEFLDVTTEESHRNLLQTWELEAGKKYELVLTTHDGLWRYRLGDVIDVIGFDAGNGSPAFKISGRRSLEIRVGPVLITDAHIMSAIQAVSHDIVEVNEYTTVLDQRHGGPTVGYLIELAGAPGPNAHLVTSRLSEGLAVAVATFGFFLKEERVRLPTVRILMSGTFAAYRQWRAEKIGVGPGQLKVPAVLQDEASKEWILERVVSEL